MNIKNIEPGIESVFAAELALGGRAAENYARLEETQRHEYLIDTLPVSVLYAPQRVHSVMADVSEEVIQNRQCFLCPEGLEDKQQTYIYRCRMTDFAIRVNPFPIFRPHYTISLYEHKRQELRDYFLHMLHFARIMPNHYIFYNGPLCGASAPDHLHFQAVRKGNLPIPDYAANRILVQDGYTYLKPFEMGAFLLQAHSQEDAELLFQKFMRIATTLEGEYEPRMNVVTSWHTKRKRYQIIIYLRRESRPKCFFKEGNAQILISPGAVEMSGVGIVSNLDSFNRLDAATFRSIIREVSITKPTINQIRTRLCLK